MVALFKSIPALGPPPAPGSNHINSHVDAFLRSHSPPPSIPQPAFVPIFCRADRVERKANILEATNMDVEIDVEKPMPACPHPSVPAGFGDLRDMLPPVQPVESIEPEMHMQHMAVVDGWRTFFFLLPLILSPCPPPRR